MLSLFRGSVTAFLFGGGLWCIYFLLGLSAPLILGEGHDNILGKCRGVCKEAYLCAFAVFSAFSCLIFLFWVNGGVIRWFLCGCVLAGFFFAYKCLQSPLSHLGQRGMLRLRGVVIWVLWLLTLPVRYCLRKTGSFALNWAKKIYLHLRGLCDTLLSVRYDKKQRRRAPKYLWRMLESMEAQDR